MSMESTRQPKSSETRIQASSQASSDQVICTLYEGDYHLGVAVLINSIVTSGFRGLFWVGHRGELPPWTAQLKRREDGLYPVGEAMLGFESISDSAHFAQWKPDFMASLFDRGIARKNLWYFDPDITVRCSWEFYERWVERGVCLCQEITMGTMASDHPIRQEWIDLAREAGWGEPVRRQERYFNSGFVGLKIEDREFLGQWSRASQLAANSGVSQDLFSQDSRVRTFYGIDQDTLNIASMYADAPLSTIGPEGMGFVDGGFTMYHSVGGAKPWRKKFLRSVFQGVPPWNGDKHFLECADDGPIRPYTTSRLGSMRRHASLASLIGRFYRRG
jgi:hypothetical protein